MKLQLTQNGTTVTIETEGDGQTGDQMAQHCRELLLGQGYHWDTITEAMPSEEDVPITHPCIAPLQALFAQGAGPQSVAKLNWTV